jgi:hypothetical protein
METTPDMDLSLRTVELVQASIRHADSKIAGISSVVGGGALFLAGQLTDPGRFGGPGGGYVAAALVSAALALLGLVGAAWQLADALRPRLSTAEETGPFGLVALAAGTSPGQKPGAGWETPEGWRLAQALARIALDKHLRVRRSLAWVFLALLGTVGWELLSAIGHIGS